MKINENTNLLANPLNSDSSRSKSINTRSCLFFALGIITFIGSLATAVCLHPHLGHSSFALGGGIFLSVCLLSKYIFVNKTKTQSSRIQSLPPLNILHPIDHQTDLTQDTNSVLSPTKSQGKTTPPLNSENSSELDPKKLADVRRQSSPIQSPPPFNILHPIDHQTDLTQDTNSVLSPAKPQDKTTPPLHSENSSQLDPKKLADEELVINHKFEDPLSSKLVQNPSLIDNSTLPLDSLQKDEDILQDQPLDDLTDEKIAFINFSKIENNKKKHFIESLFPTNSEALKSTENKLRQLNPKEIDTYFPFFKKKHFNLLKKEQILALNPLKMKEANSQNKNIIESILPSTNSPATHNRNVSILQEFNAEQLNIYIHFFKETHFSYLKKEQILALNPLKMKEANSQNKNIIESILPSTNSPATYNRNISILQEFNAEQLNIYIHFFKETHFSYLKKEQISLIDFSKIENNKKKHFIESLFPTMSYQLAQTYQRLDQITPEQLEICMPFFNKTHKQYLEKKSK
ncbi:MAG: hypothetical protein R3E91_01235 [Chlamydiales bacterium]